MVKKRKKFKSALSDDKLTEYQIKLLQAARGIKVLGWFDSLDWINAMGEPVRDPSVETLIEKGYIEQSGSRFQVTEAGRKFVTALRHSST